MILQGELGSFVKLDNIKREFPELDDYWDGNWLVADVNVEIPNFTAHCNTWFRVAELQDLHDDLIKLSNLVIKEVQFTPLELGFILEFSINKRGIITCTGSVSDAHGDNNLDFTFETYLSFIDNFIKGLKSILIQYPLVGKKE